MVCSWSFGIVALVVGFVNRSSRFDHTMNFYVGLLVSGSFILWFQLRQVTKTIVHMLNYLKINDLPENVLPVTQSTPTDSWEACFVAQLLQYKTFTSLK